MSKNSTVLTRKEMKEPDKFQVAAEQAAGWLTAHRKQVVGALIAVAALLVVLVAVSAVQSRRATRAGAALAEVMSAMGGEISSVPLPGVPGPFYATEQARQQAVLAAAQKVLVEYGGTDAAHTAALAAGDANLKLGNADAAIQAYQRYLSDASKGDSLRFAALEGLAVAEEAKGNADAALAAYDRLAKEVPAFSDRADLERARILAQAGKRDEARQILAAFPDQHKESLLAGDAAERLARLGGK